MIYVNVRGNFGNQLFEYACARMLQEKYNQQICLNIYNLTKYKKEYVFNLSGYKLNDNVIVEKKKKIPFYANLRNPIYRLLRKICPQLLFDILKKFGIFIWLENTYVEFPNRNYKNIYIDGYWQSDKYFEEIEDVLKREFVPKKENNKENLVLEKKIESSECVCVSIRRGDYISNQKFRDKFYICDEKYFLKAFNEIKKYVNNPTFFICSDDIEWAKENIRLNEECYYETGRDDVFEKIRLMSKCKHYILSNSSFSWWAQYLSKSKNKIVIAPSKWYVNGEKTDIYQDDWKLINIE